MIKIKERIVYILSLKEILHFDFFFVFVDISYEIIIKFNGERLFRKERVFFYLFIHS